MNYQKVKGTEDFYPEENAKLNYIFDQLKNAAKKFAFREAEPPILETFKLLSAKSGEEIKQQMFMLEQKGEELLALRPEFTPGFARMLVAKERELAKPVKWYTINRCWRYEAPQKGRAREFFQFNVELYGSSKPEADAQCIRLVITCLENLGLSSKEFVIRLNNRKLMEGLLEEYVPISQIEKVARLIDKFEKVTEAEFKEELTKTGIEKNGTEKITSLVQLKGSIQEISQKLGKITGKAAEGLEELRKIAELLPQEYVRVDLCLMRGFAYYTGTVFEAFDKTGKFRALAGGGRYDNLVELYGGQKTPAVGFGMGDKVLTLILEDRKLIPKSDLGPEYFVVSVNEEVRDTAWTIACKLQKKYVVDVDLMERKFSKQLEYANAIKAKNVIIVGPDELKKGKVKTKNMETGKETLKNIEEL